MCTHTREYTYVQMVREVMGKTRKHSRSRVLKKEWGRAPLRKEGGKLSSAVRKSRVSYSR